MTALVLLVDGDPVSRLRMESGLRQSGIDVLAARDAAEARRLLGEVRPSLVVADSGNDGGAAALVGRLRAGAQGADLPLLLLVDDLSAEPCQVASVHGVDCLVKPVGPHELVMAIRRRLRRHDGRPDEGPVVLDDLILEPGGRNVRSGRGTAHLGPTEYRLLHFMMTHPERVYGRKHLVDQIWGDRVAVADRTVDVLIRRLRAQLEPIGCQHMIQTVRGAGYRFSAEPLRGNE